MREDLGTCLVPRGVRSWSTGRVTARTRAPRMPAITRSRGSASGAQERRALIAPSASTPSRAFIRDLFVRLLGVVFLIAFLSLLAQGTLLFGREGLLPPQDFLRPPRGFLHPPTIFWPGPSDGRLR